jgi:LuxR family transcriptional regulator, maltose regulon positive regulatory protein
MHLPGAGESVEKAETAQHGEITPDRCAPVVAAKVGIPAMPPTVLVRERLHVLLDAAVAGTDVGPSVTVVCAPAGTGKTTMLATWARRRVERSGGRVAWVSVDTEDNDPALLWSAVFRALEISGAVESFAVPEGESYAPFVAALIATVERATEPVVLVLDGVHDLRSTETLRMVDFLLRHSPPTMPIVLAARFPPPLILPRLRVEGRVREVGPDNLTFTATEARLAYARHGVELSGDELGLLMERTEGWAAGLRLAAITAEDPERKAEGVQLTDFTGEEHVVADYLIGEVVARQPEEVQEFMLATCVCRSFTAQLAAELADQENSGQIIDWLERTGILVSKREAAGRAYRYHPLLRGYLRAELGRRQLSALHQRHRIVAGWYLATGDQLRAIEHAAAAGDDDLTTRLIAKHGLAQVLDGHAERLRTVLDAARPHVLARPSVALVAAATALDLGDLLGADRFLRAVDGTAHPLRTQRLRALQATVHLQRSRLLGETADALAALKATRAGQTGDVDVDLLTLANRGIALQWAGQPDAAAEDLRQALHLAATERRDAIALQCETHLASVAAAAGDLSTMGRRARSALALADARDWGGASRAAYAYALLAGEAYEHGEDERAKQLVTLASGLMDGPVDPAIELFTLSLSAMVDFDNAADPHQVVATLREGWRRLAGPAVAPGFVAHTAPAYQRMALLVGEWMWAAEVLERVEELLGESGEGALLRANLHAHKGKVASTRRLVALVLDGSVASVVPLTRLSAWLLEAHLAARCDEHNRAHEALGEALALAAPHEAVRPFIDAGPSVRALLARGAGRFGRLDQFATRVLTQIPTSAPDPTDALTEREQALLAELPSMRTAEEIAHTMFVSVNTVKTHLRGIYRKLGVSHRRDAITVARQRGLL